MIQGLISSLGVGGIGLGVFLNGLGVPGLSEVLLPLGGAAVSHGRMNLVVLLLVALVSQLVGLSAAYFIAKYGGHALIVKYGKYILVSHRELAAVEKTFEKYGQWLVLFGAFIPGIQGFIGYVAGLAEMNFARFVIAALVGKLVWIGGLVYLGSVLGSHVGAILASMRQVGVLVLAAVLGVGFWYLYTHRQRRRDKGAKN